MPKQRLWTKDFICASSSSFFMFMTFYMLMAVLPVYVIEELKQSENRVGLVMTSFLLAAVISRPFIGKWVDHIGRRKMLVVSLALFLAASFMYTFVTGFVLLLAIRFFHGFSFGMATTTVATVATETIPASRRGEGIGYYGMFMNLAMAIGPSLGLFVILTYSFRVLFIICFFAALLALLLSLSVKTVEVVRKEEKQKTSWKDAIEPSALPIAFIVGVFGFAYAGVTAFLPIYAKEIGSIESASYFFVVYAVVMMLSRPFIGKIFDQYGENVIVYPAIILFAIGLLILSMATSGVYLMLSAVFIGLGYGAIFPCFQAIVVNKAPKGRLGATTSTYYMLLDLGLGMGSMVLGVVVTMGGYHQMYFISMLLVLVGLVLYHVIHGRKRIEEKKLAA